MGVPNFFIWLTTRYPNILIEAREGLKIGSKLEEMPPIDNLYFDMNGIIHPCAHPEGREPPSSLAEMFNNIFDYCDKLIRIIRPKKLIFFAIDGVAPRAKMNQQRSRRFRAALSAQQEERIYSEIEKEWREKELPTDFLGDKKKEKKFKFDSNCITPGTDFLAQCSIAVRTYIKSRLNNNPLWSGLNIVFSDASVPGEGEHKILDFIRTQRAYETYDPNTYHCMYGADADLIMLSLIMHEPHFCVIRESLKERNYQNAHKKKESGKIEFSLIKIGIVRHYLELEFSELIKNKLDLERIIDDFVFMGFLVGNDFLPNMPSLKIREGAIDALVYLYKKIRIEIGDYLTNGKGQLNLNSCEKLFDKLSLVEDQFFQNEIRNKNLKRNNPKEEYKILNVFKKIPFPHHTKEKSRKNSNKDLKNKNEINSENFTGNLTSKGKEENLKNYFDLKKLKLNEEEIFNEIIKEAINEENNKKVAEYEDKIKLGKKGWKDRYYMEKFHVSPKSGEKALIDLKQKIKQYYIEGLCWVFEYYYNGCISWSWFYPFHYAPFASDLIHLNDLKINFDLNSPFYAFEQLLSVLPPYSAEALPKPFRKLMIDPLSPISDFYPSNIRLDINNQPYAWMGVNLLPFVDADRIRKIVEIVMKKGELTEEDKKLNIRGDNILITRDLNVSDYFQGDLSIHELMNTYGKFLKEDSEIKGIHPGNVNKDKSQIYIFRKKINGKNHCSQLLNGVKKDPEYNLKFNLDNSKKEKYKGNTAIRIVEKVLTNQKNYTKISFNRKSSDNINRAPHKRYSNSTTPKRFLNKKRRTPEKYQKDHHRTNLNRNNRNRYNPRYSKYQKNNINNEEKPLGETISLKEEDEKENKSLSNAKTEKKFRDYSNKRYAKKEPRQYKNFYNWKSNTRSNNFSRNNFKKKKD